VRSSLIISDEPLSAETGQDTEFVVVLSDEPQGGVKSHKTFSVWISQVARIRPFRQRRQ
jgi:hypothetical protein